MDPQVIVSIIIGLGMIGGMWRLTREVAALTATMTGMVGRVTANERRVDNHDERIRSLEIAEAAHGKA